MERLDYESRITRAEMEARSYQKELASIQKKKQIELEHVIKTYHESQAFLDFIDKHDDQVRPDNMSVGWDRAVHVINRQYPDFVHPHNFPTPDWVENMGSYVEQGPTGEAVPQVSGSASRGSRRTSSSQSRGEVAAPKDKGKAVMREPLPGRGQRNQLSSSSESDSDSSEEVDAEKESAGKGAEAESGSEEETTDSEEESGSEEGEDEPVPKK